MVEPTSSSSSLRFASDADKILARLAVRKRFVTQQHIAGALARQQQLYAQGRRISMAEILQRTGLITEKQTQALMMVTRKALERLSQAGPSVGASAEAERVAADPLLEAPQGRAPEAVLASIRGQLLPPELRAELSRQVAGEARSGERRSSGRRHASASARRQRTQPPSSGLTVHLPKDRIAKMRQEMTPEDFKKALVELLRDGALNGPAVPDQVPESFGPYSRLRPLGQGGMAQVFQVYDEDLRKDVALKVMRPGIAREREYVLRFLREASNTALIRHPNTVELYSMGAVEGWLYFTLELIEGQTLKERMNEGRIPPRKALEILRQTMEGLIAAHEQGITHRDLKPSNIMLTTDEAQFGMGIQGESSTVVKITDFGLARMMDGEVVGTITQEGQFLGTAKYVAPELIRGAEGTLQSDIFALGIMAFQMFSGQPPFRVKRKVDYIEANLNGVAPLVHEVAPEIAPGISTLVDAMLDKDPLERPTAGSLLRDIERLEGMAPGEDDPGAVEDPSSVFCRERVTRKSKRGGGAAGEWQEVLQDKRVLGAAGGALALLVLLALYLSSGGPREVEPPPGPGPGPTRPPKPGPGEGPEVAPISELDGFPAVLEPPLAAFQYDRTRLQTFIDAVRRGDQAWAGGSEAKAQEAWKEAAALHSPPSLERRLEAAARQAFESALRAAKNAEDWERVAELCREATEAGIASDQTPRLLDQARDKLRAQRRGAELIAELEGQLSAEDVDAATTTLRELEQLRLTEGLALVDPKDRFRELRRRLEDARDAAQARRAARKYFDQAREFLGKQSFDLAQTALDAARGQVGATTEVRELQKLIDLGTKAPEGYVLVLPGIVELFGQETELGAYYVPREPISNNTYLLYLASGKGDGQPRPRGWVGGNFPEEARDQPVLRVTEEQAQRYAESLGGRLPTRVERARIDDALKLGSHSINRLNPQREFEDGFRIVIPLEP